MSTAKAVSRSHGVRSSRPAADEEEAALRAEWFLDFFAMDGKKISAALESGGESKGRRELNCREVSRDE